MALTKSNLKFFKEAYNIVTLSLLYPFAKEHCHLLQDISIPFTQWCFISSLISSDQVLFEKKARMWNDRQTDRRQSFMTKTLSSVKLKMCSM